MFGPFGGWDDVATLSGLTIEKAVRRFPRRDPDVDPLAFTRDGKRLAGIHLGGILRVRNVATAEELFRVRTGSSFHALAMSPLKDQRLTAEDQGLVQFW
jgi:hypothetical protein